MPKYKSRFEQKIARNIAIPFTYEKHRYKYTMEKTYTPDFFLDNGIIIETKGKFTSEDRRKHLAVKATHPELDIRFVFMRDNYVRKNSRTKYSDWCRKNGYQYAIGHVPEEWQV